MKFVRYEYIGPESGLAAFGDRVVGDAQGIEARQRHDREAGHGPKDESPVAESDAP